MGYYRISSLSNNVHIIWIKESLWELIAIGCQDSDLKPFDLPDNQHSLNSSQNNPNGHQSIPDGHQNDLNDHHLKGHQGDQINLSGHENYVNGDQNNLTGHHLPEQSYKLENVSTEDLLYSPRSKKGNLCQFELIQLKIVLFKSLRNCKRPNKENFTLKSNSNKQTKFVLEWGATLSCFK